MKVADYISPIHILAGIGMGVAIIGILWITQALITNQSLMPTIVNKPQTVIPQEYTINWIAEDKGTDENGVPLTLLTIEKIHTENLSDMNRFEIGTEAGTCFDITETEWKKVDGEIAGAICWYAGGGTEYAVFIEDGTYVLKKGLLGEGTAEAPSARGPYTFVQAL
jgi:hypothetical protein